MEKLGLLRDIDLALHLPLRYEDETRLTRLRDARDGDTVQVEGVVTDNRVEQRSRRQLLVRLDDGSGEVLLRFLNFYGSQQKSWAPGVRLRVRGELRHGFWGREMVHPTVRIVQADTPLAESLTPIYPTGAGLPQAYLRKAVASALQRAPLDKHHDWRTPVLATVDGQGRPQARTVVLRHADRATQTLVFFTDARSPKCAELRAQQADDQRTAAFAAMVP